MHLTSNITLFVLALIAANGLTPATALPPRLRGRYVPSMAPGSSDPEATSDHGGGGAQNRVVHLHSDGAVRLPGVNHKPVVAANGAGAAAAAAAAGNGTAPTTVFGRRCRLVTLLGDGKKGHSTLQAACRDGEEATGGTWWLTSLNLNRCLGNDGGRLVFQERGNYDETCRPCGIEALRPDGPVMMRCACVPAPGRTPTFTELSLDSQGGDLGIRVVGGRLVCGAQQGTKSPRFNTSSDTDTS